MLAVFGDGRGAFGRMQSLAISSSAPSDLEVDDLNDDGFLDLTVMSSNGWDFDLTIYKHNGISDFLSPPDTYDVDPRITEGLGLGDVNGDGS